MNICNHPAGERVVFVWVAPHFPLKYCMNIIMCLAPFGIHIWIHTTVSKCTTVQLYTQRWFNEGLCFSMWLGPFYISHAYTRLVPSYNGEYTSMTAWWICHAAYYIRWVYMLCDDDGDGLTDMPCCLFHSVGICCMRQRRYMFTRRLCTSWACNTNS